MSSDSDSESKGEDSEWKSDSGGGDDDDDFEPKKKKAAPKKAAKAKADGKTATPKAKAKASTKKKSGEAKEAKSEKAPAKKRKASDDGSGGGGGGGAAVGAGAGAGAAKAAKPGVELTGDDAENAVRQYMTATNRPYSSLQVWENLHRNIKKPQVIRIMDKLAEDGVLTAKAWKKNKIYWLNQDKITVAPPTEGDVKRAEQEIVELTAQLKAAESACATLNAELQAYSTQMSEPECDSLISKLTAETNQKSARLARLTSSSSGGAPPTVTKAQIDAAQKNFAKFYKEWAKRKNAVRDMVGTILDQGNGKMKPPQFMEEQGIETDEDHKVDIKTYEKWLRK